MAGADIDEKEAVEGKVEEDDPDWMVVDILRSLPRPLMPLLEFLYRVAKYSHSSLSCDET
jgi:hypothetical protein